MWDWGRAELPTEFQFRNLERAENSCTDNDLLRRTLIDIFEQAKKSKVPYADLVDQKVGRRSVSRSRRQSRAAAHRGAADGTGDSEFAERHDRKFETAHRRRQCTSLQRLVRQRVASPR